MIPTRSRGIIIIIQHLRIIIIQRFRRGYIMFFTPLSIIAVLIGVSIASIGDVCRAPQGSGTCKSENSCTAGMHRSIYPTILFQEKKRKLMNTRHHKALRSSTPAPTTPSASNAASKPPAKTIPANASTNRAPRAPAELGRRTFVPEAVMYSAARNQRHRPSLLLLRRYPTLSSTICAGCMSLRRGIRAIDRRISW